MFCQYPEEGQTLLSGHSLLNQRINTPHFPKHHPVIGIPRAPMLLQCLNHHDQEAPSFCLCPVQVETQDFQ